MRLNHLNAMGTLATLLVLLFASVQPALAHHPLSGMPMETFSHGLLSGIGHPILGFDHLFFIIAAGILAVGSGVAAMGPLALIAGVVAGVLLTMTGFVVPAAEFFIALSLLLLGVLGIRGKTLPWLLVLSLFAVLGVLHGWAFGQAIVATESASLSVLSAYLLGLCMVQYTIAVLAGKMAFRFAGAIDASALQPRVACAITTGVGLTYLLENVEVLVFV